MILVTGCARSGTSLTAQILQELGCDLGPEKSVNGLYENFDIRQNLTKPFLASLHADPLGQNPLPDMAEVLTVNWPDLRDRVLEKMGNPQEPWAYKGAKMCLIWPVWARAFPEAKWIIVRRDREKIVDSCMRTGFMRAYHARKDWRAWAETHERRFDEMRTTLDCLEVWPDDYVENGVEEMCEFAGLDHDAGAMERVFDAGRWH